MASLILVLAVTTTGLYAGFLLTFLFVVMPGLAALPDEGFTAAMRRINEKVPGPGFLWRSRYAAIRSLRTFSRKRTRCTGGPPGAG
ncbi:hypothetical protein [Streptomyces sp. NPDC088726]|uniref:hypothetical protein n=1 Tax=Streptomyces sp. NPDC088726 TaxID=3365874 RepID=UPI0037F98F63